MSLIRVAILDGDPLIIAGKHLLIDSQPDLLIVYEQADAAKAIEELPEQLIDVILIDQRLKGMDGVSAAKRLSENYRLSGQKVPRLVLSAPYSSAELIAASELAGIDEIFTIENEPESLLEAIRRVKL